MIEDEDDWYVYDPYWKEIKYPGERYIARECNYCGGDLEVAVVGGDEVLRCAECKKQFKYEWEM